ncbi:MAG: GNAT family N-acetyltransferase, partial [Acidobacteriota bacterium]
VAEVPEIRTQRLLLRAFRAEDAEPYLAMCADPEVMRWVSGEPLSAEDAWRQLAMFAGHWTLRGFGSWTVEERASGRFVGRIGLHYPEGWPDRELGWALARPFWGQGYAAEGARAALAHAFDTLGWDHLVSLIHPENERSIRLATRLGARFQGTAAVRGHSVSVYSYRTP